MKHKSCIFTFIGLAFLFAALCFAGYNMYAEQNANKESMGVLSVLNGAMDENSSEPSLNDLPDYLLYPNMEMPEKEIDGRYYVGTVFIPALNVDLPVLSQWSYAGLRISPCRYSGSVYQNNAIICAHNYTSHFGKFRRLPVGEKVIFQDISGNIFRYVIFEKEMLDGSDVEGLNAGDWDLTLFTCTVGGVQRITLRCKLEK